MAYTGMGPEITLPATRRRPWGTFKEVVPEIKVESEGADRTAMGVRYMAPGAYSPILADYSCSSTDTKTGNMTLTEVVQPAYLSFNLLECSTLTGSERRLEGDLNDIYEATISEALAQAATGLRLSTSHHTLWNDSTILTTGANITETIGNIEDGLAERISNEQGYIFVAPRVLAAAKAAGAVFILDGQLYSPGGHLVVSDAGHGFDNWVFGTGAIGWSVLPVPGTEHSFDRSRNINLWMREHYGLVVFNPAHSVRAAITGAASD